MKLRLHGNSIRLRLAREEVERLAREGLVEERTSFPDGGLLEWRLALADGVAEVSARWGDGRLEVVLPRAVALAWAASEDEGLYGEHALAGGRLAIAVEKDFPCGHREPAGS